MNSQPFFSVIIPTYNRRDFLKAAINSVLEQTFKNFELIVIDDGSCDTTRELLEAYKDERLTYIYQDHYGVALARNNGIKRAKGLFIAFLDSDDCWKPEKLERTREYINRFGDISIFHTEEIWYKNGKLLRQLEKHKKPSGWVYQKALAICCIGMSTSVVRKNIFDSIGMFDEDFDACEDYDLWLRITNKHEVKLIPEALTIKDGGRPDQLSANVWGLDRFRIKALEKILSSGKLDASDYKATLEELDKKCRIFSMGATKHGENERAAYYAALHCKYQKFTPNSQLLTPSS